MQNKVPKDRSDLNNEVRKIGDILTKDECSEQQKAHGFQQYLSAAENGDVQSMFEIARCFNYGIGTKCNIVYATIWMNKAAAKGNEDAINALANYNRTLKTPFPEGFFTGVSDTISNWHVRVPGNILREMGFNHFEDTDNVYDLRGLSDGMFLVGKLNYYDSPDEDGFGEEYDFFYGYYDEYMYPIIPFIYARAQPFKDGKALVADNEYGNDWYTIDKTGLKIG